MRPIIRRLLVALIRRTSPPGMTPAESLSRIVAEVDTAADDIAHQYGATWRGVVSS